MKTWTMEFDAEQLDMLSFCVEQMGQMLTEDLQARDAKGCGQKCEHGTKRLSKSQLRRDIKTANRILAAVYRGQVNLELAATIKPKRRASKC